MICRLQIYRQVQSCKLPTIMETAMSRDKHSTDAPKTDDERAKE